MSKRSAPVRHCRASGSTAARCISFIPWVSDTESPNPTRRIVANPAVTAWRGQGRVSLVPGRPLRADDDRGGLEAHGAPGRGTRGRSSRRRRARRRHPRRRGCPRGSLRRSRPARGRARPLRARGPRDRRRARGWHPSTRSRRRAPRTRAPLAQAAEDLADGFVEQCSFIVRGHDDRKCGGHGGRLPTS